MFRIFFQLTIWFVHALGLFAMIAMQPTAHAEETRRWRLTCTYVKSSADDPIKYPFKPNAGDLHDFYGNVGVNANTVTVSSLVNHDSHCPHGDQNAYWIAALYRNGIKLTPDWIQVYYENKSLAAGALKAFPAGYKYFLGNEKATNSAQSEHHWIWGCSDQTQFGDDPPVHCTSDGIHLRGEFPNCWDGVLSADGNAAGHVTWANGLGTPGRGEKVADPAANNCPAGYPKALPMLRITVHYLTGNDVGKITLSSGSPYTKHGAFINVADPEKMQRQVDECLNTPNATCPHFTGAPPVP